MNQRHILSKHFDALLLFVLGGIIFATGCGSSTPADPSISVTVNPQNAALGTSQTIQLTATVSDGSGIAWSASSGTIDTTGNYTAPSGAQSLRVTVTATSVKDHTKSANATLNVVAPGQVAATANVQVASYMISPPAAGNVSVQFGTDTNYGLTTWAQPVPNGGGAVNLFVAGMKGNTQYHLRGVVQFSDGTQYTDTDQTFTTGAYPTADTPVFTVSTKAGATPQSGVELLDLVAGGGTVSQAVVTDLAGNVLWSYNPALQAGVQANPIKLLSNGHFLINFSLVNPDGANSILQEVDLTGKLIWQMTAADFNTALAAAVTAGTCGGDGCNITVLGTHHDFVLLPNGHLIVLAGVQNTTIVPGTTVTGDVVIDLDQNHKPVWTWNEFDHPNSLPITRQPMGWPDWTHTNAVIYSADDGNLIISIRHQNWLLKLPYNNGAGSGDAIWRLGYQGDFTLAGGTDPTDWFYAQHGPSFVTTNTTGQFSLILFDNGNDRFFPSGQMTCGVQTTATCYSTVPLLQLDETAKTATLAFNPTAPVFSFFGGNAAVLKNGNVEYCESAAFHGGAIFEITQDSNPQTIWEMQSGFDSAQLYPFMYRGQRIPSLYPGVQW